MTEAGVKGFGIGVVSAVLLYLVLKAGGWMFSSSEKPAATLLEAERKLYEERMQYAKDHAKNLLDVKDEQLVAAKNALKEAVAAKTLMESECASKLATFYAELEKYKQTADKTEVGLRAKIKELERKGL